MHQIKRYPRGTWMKLVSAQRLRSFVGPEHDKKMSARKLARYCGLHPSFIDHLISGRRNSATPLTAQHIAEALQVPLDVLFVVEEPSAACHNDKQHKVAA